MSGDLACTYAALILSDDGQEVTADKMDTVIKAAEETLFKDEVAFDTFDARLQQIAVALSGDQRARADSGGTSDVALHNIADVVYKRAILTHSERQLIRILKRKKKNIEVRADIQPSVRKIRGARMSERSELPINWYLIVCSALASK